MSVSAGSDRTGRDRRAVMPGIIMSTIATSNGSPPCAASRSSVSAWRPLSKARSRHPHSPGARSRMVRFVRLSSTTARGTREARGASAGGRRLARAPRNRHGEPERAAPAASLSTPISPPISSTMRLQSPGPGRCRRTCGWSSSSSLGERLEEAACASGAMPMPVSATSKRTRRRRLRRSAPRRAARAHDYHFAGLGELDGVADQVDQHLAQPAGVADAAIAGRRARRRRRARSPCRGAAGASSSTTSSITSWSSKSAASSSTLPASIFEKSRMSLMIASSASPESRTPPRTRAAAASGRCRAAVRSCRSRRSWACESRGSWWRRTHP